MTQYVKFISENQITFAPKNYTTDDGTIIFNFNTNPEVMFQYGFKPFIRAKLEENKTYYFSYKGYDEYVQEIATEIPGPTPEEIAEWRRQNFHEEFFPTSLGYVRRTVTKANGNQADFLFDYLPSIQIAVSKGITYPLVLYEEPDFTQPVDDWTVYQHRLPATEQFIIDCLNQIANDFIPQVQSQQNEGE
jgi:hypothetical protein